MILGIMQPYLFPYIGYYQLINTVDKFVVYDDVNYINRGWINRNNILMNNKATLFTIPLKNASQNRLIGDIELADSLWKGKFLKTLEQAYKKAPHFNNVFSLISDIVLAEAAQISQLANKSLQSVADYLELTTEFVTTSAVYKNNHLKGQHRILDICLQEKVVHYINPIGGMEIYSKELFSESAIRLNFISTKSISYQQFGKEFIPNLSIIDVLMFNSRDQVKEMLNMYELL